MTSGIERLTKYDCSHGAKEKVCRSRGGESCAFDGAMIVLQPIADAAHIVHGPIACCGNSWEGRGTLSRVGTHCSVPLLKMGFTTDMSEMDIIYGSEEKLYNAILQTCERVNPKAVFVYATCVSGLIGEDIESVCKKAEAVSGARVIPVNAPGFTGPKNLGNRISGEVLLDHVIGTGEPPGSRETGAAINLIGEYNIAGDLWLVEPVLRQAGIGVLSRMTGDSTFEEITWAHRAKLNVVVCGRALINVAREMERRYGIPYVEASFFGKTEMSKALRTIAGAYRDTPLHGRLEYDVERVIDHEERRLDESLKAYGHLRGKKAVLYTGGVKSWSFISALGDLGIEVVAVGTKKSTAEDEGKMREIMGEGAPLVEDVTPRNLLRLLRERNADILVAGGRNQYLAIKEGYPFVDVNQERHVAYAGYDGLVNLAEHISNSIEFYTGIGNWGSGLGRRAVPTPKPNTQNPVVINPLKHSQAIGAAIAFQGIDKAIPVVHGAQGCTFLSKVLLTKHFREPIALAGTKLFTEDVVMGSEERLLKTVGDLMKKNSPEVIGLLTTGLSEVKGEDVTASTKDLRMRHPGCALIHVPTPDYEEGLETGYAKALEAIIKNIAGECPCSGVDSRMEQVNVLAGAHLTPADFRELREIIESFGLRPVFLPDLSALDGSRQGFSPLATGGTPVAEIRTMGLSRFTFAIGLSMEPAARQLSDRFDIEYRVFESIAGLADTDTFVEALSMLSGRPVPSRYVRQRHILVDGMRDAHFHIGGKNICLALEADHAVQVSRLIREMGAVTSLAVIPNSSLSAEGIQAREVAVGDLFSIRGDLDLLISSSHGEGAAKRLGVPLYQAGFPVYKSLGNTAKVTIGYRGTLGMINEMANMLDRGNEATGKNVTREERR